ncbi:unnamed protein product [Bathycoccus prasinos]
MVRKTVSGWIFIIFGVHFVIVSVFSTYAIDEKFDEKPDSARQSKLDFRLAASWSKRFCNWKIFLPKAPSSDFKNKIFGVATGSLYTFEKLLPFCKSIRIAGFRGVVVIGVSKLKGSEERKRNKMFDKYNISRVYLDATKGADWGQSICRYYTYMEFLDHFANRHDSVLVTDVRDVIFQEDPFNSSPYGSQNLISSDTNLLLFEEGLNDISEAKVTLRNTGPNFRWLTTVYGHKKFDQIKNNTPLCSGTTIGTKAGLKYYTMAMLLQGYLCLKRNARKFIKNRGHVCSGGADQGFHNFLFWNRMLIGAVSIRNGAGPVYTIGSFRGKPVKSLDFDRDMNGRVVSPSQRGAQYAVPIIHQWDRHKDLVKYVYEKYNLKLEGVPFHQFDSRLSKGSFTGKHG